MVLTQGEINRSAVMAVLIVKAQSTEGLQKILDETITEELCGVFQMKLRAQLARITKKTIDDFSDEFMTDLVSRICGNAKHMSTIVRED